MSIHPPGRGGSANVDPPRDPELDVLQGRLADGLDPADGPSATTQAAVATRAADADLLDVAYTELDSPFGSLLAAATPRGLAMLAYLDHHDRDPLLERLAAELSPRVLEAPARIEPVRRELGEYFEGRRQDFDLALDRSLTHGFTRRVLEHTSRIGYGQTVSYADVAGAVGSPRGFRAAGRALGANPIPIVVPCHRVLRAGGGLGGYTGGLERKRALLAIEGVTLTA